MLVTCAGVQPRDAEMQIVGAQRPLSAVRSGDTRCSERAWLYNIATNTCLDVIARRPKRTLPIDHVPAAGFGETPGRPLTESVWVEPCPDLMLGLQDGRAAPEARYEQREGVELAFIVRSDVAVDDGHADYPDHAVVAIFERFGLPDCVASRIGGSGWARRPGRRRAAPRQLHFRRAGTVGSAVTVRVVHGWRRASLRGSDGAPGPTKVNRETG